MADEVDAHPSRPLVVQVSEQAQRTQMPLQLFPQKRRALAAACVARLLAAHEDDGLVRTRLDGEVRQRGGVGAGERRGDGRAPGQEGRRVRGCAVDDVGDELRDVVWMDVVHKGKGREQEKGRGLGVVGGTSALPVPTSTCVLHPLTCPYKTSSSSTLKPRGYLTEQLSQSRRHSSPSAAASVLAKSASIRAGPPPDASAPNPAPAVPGTALSTELTSDFSEAVIFCFTGM
ncbi:hypothetical protein Trco_004794 [Trichoderma cornu-damae]|uniref:Uncharacterized protein n=1 Tax=Trichoderma cornu-damae TaxID=654480 RepID=A0A9P8QI60_9HYPO|nr:hypothetical protein Trco_004794 [Trichoderma cornu-damae]